MYRRQGGDHPPVAPFVTRQSVPVSAMMKFPPEMPIWLRNGAGVRGRSGHHLRVVGRYAKPLDEQVANRLFRFVDDWRDDVTAARRQVGCSPVGFEHVNPSRLPR